MWRRGLAPWAALLAWAVAGGAWSQTAALQTRLAHPERPDFLVLEYAVRHDMLEEPDTTPRLRVFGDGRVHVHYPPYMKRAGDYELRLEGAELRELLQSLQGQGLLDFDAEATRDELERLSQRRMERTGEVFETSDVSHSVITVRLESYAPAGAAAIDDFARTVIWPDLQQAAERHPEVPALQGLAAAERELRRLLEDERLRSVAP